MRLRSTLTVAVALVSGLTLTMTATPAHAAYEPTAGPVFSAPGDGKIAGLIRKNIKGTKRGATIRAASALTDAGIVNALIRAHGRGVKVRMVIPIHATRGCGTSEADRLARAIGTNLDSRSWVKCVQGSARNAAGSAGHMHMKVWAFSRVRSKREVMIVTSANATANATARQYNDAHVSVGFSSLYGAWAVDLFPQLRDDNGGGFWQRTWDASGAYATPVAASADPILARLKAIPGPGARIRVAVSTIEYARSATRAVRIARQLVRLKRAGAKVHVVHTKSLRSQQRAVALMCRKGIPVRHYRNVGDTGPAYLHSKYMTASYVTGGKSVHRTWTGSEEWKASSFNQDEFVLQLGARKVHKAYAADFGRHWKRTRSSC